MFRLRQPNWRNDALGLCILFVGIGVVCFALAITIRCYMPCPFWDEWVVIDGIAKGDGIRSWAWLWSQQNEHRIVVPRLLIWLDLSAFGGKNVSLFVEIFAVQLFHLAAIWFVVERFTSFPTFLKRSIEGLFAFGLFHPNQVENLTWAFQIGFVLPYMLGTVALIIIAFFSRWRHPRVAVAVVAVVPMVAAMNLAAGLLIGPIALIVAYLKRLSRGVTLTLAATVLVSWFVYLYGYHGGGTDLSPLKELLRGKDLFVYVLTYFGASWTRLLPHKERLIAFISIIVFLALSVRSVRKRREITDFEWFLLGECIFTFATASLTAFGRVQFGVGQAFASRYQTPAMIYWIALASLVLLWFQKNWPSHIVPPEAFVLAVMLLSISTFPRTWVSTISHATGLQAACQRVMGPYPDKSAAAKLYENTRSVTEGRAFLLKVWRRE